LDTQAHTDFANKRYQLEDLELNMTVHMAGLPDGQIGLHMTADGGADLKQESISLDPFVLTLDQDTVRGELNIKSFSRPNIRFALSSKALNLDPWLTTDEPIAAAAPAKSDDVIALPTEMLRSLNLMGEIDVAELNVSGLTLGKLKTKLVSKSGVLEIKQLDADFYQGHINAQAKLDVRKSEPRYVVSSTLQDIQLAPLMSDVIATKKPMLRGLVMAQFSVNTHGQRVSQLRKNLAGDARLKVSDGVLVNKGLTRALEQVMAVLEGKSPSKEVLLKEASASASIVAGLLTNKDLKLKTSLLDGHGRGQVNIANGTIDYLLMMGLPIRVHGPWNDIQYSVDVKDAIKGKVGKQFDKEKKKIKKEIKEKAKDLFGDKLKNLF